jgi:hypothetical protein
MREVVHEQEAVGVQPARDAREQRAVIAHVLEHLDRDHAIEARVGLERVHVGGHDREVVEEGPVRRLADRLRLTLRVRDRQHARARIPLRAPERERAPAAAEVEHALAVGQLRALPVQAQHLGLGLGEVAHARSPVCAAVLAVRAEHELEEGRRHLVVLAVGGVGRERNRSAARLGEERLVTRELALRVGGFEVAQAVAQQSADAGTQDGVRQQSSLREGESEHGGLPWARAEARRRLARCQYKI